jgi:methionyl-tRNA formyltransferase
MGYSIECIVVRKFTFSRFKDEFSRDGKRLLKKIWKKLVLKEAAYSNDSNTIRHFRAENNLTVKSVEEFKKLGTAVEYCNELNDKNVEETLKSYSDKIVIFTGGGIIRSNIINVSGDGIINCHMGILPRYKGMDLPEWCILENKTDELGITLHFMDTGIDTGNILRKVKIPLADHEQIKNLRNSFEPIMVESMVGVVDDYLNGRIEPMTQNPNLKRQYFIVHEKLYRIVNTKLRTRGNVSKVKMG